MGGKSLGEALLAIHRPYITEYDALIDADVDIKGLVHVTGGGLWDNPPRILPDNVTVRITKGTWELPPLFKLIQKTGNVSDEEMAHVFNIGLGMLIFVSEEQVDKAGQVLGSLKQSQHQNLSSEYDGVYYRVGDVIARDCAEANNKPVVFNGTQKF